MIDSIRHDKIIIKNNSIINRILAELSILDNEIHSLLNDRINTSSIYSIQLHRGRLSKRLVNYEDRVNIILEYYNNNTFSDSKEELSSLYHTYLSNLKRYKICLNDWWLGIEKKFNQLCLTSFVTESSLNKSIVKHVQLKDKLSETKNMMLSLDSQMQASESSILKSSEYINEQEAFYRTFKNHLNIASSLLSQLHYRTFKRKRFVYSCYFFQLFMCGFIILRRLSIIRIVIWVLSLIFKILKLPLYILGILSYKSSNEPSIEVIEPLMEVPIEVIEPPVEVPIKVIETSIEPLMDVIEPPIEPLMDVIEPPIEPLMDVIEPLMDVIEPPIEPIIDDYEYNNEL